jgi:hypothetical protein
VLQSQGGVLWGSCLSIKESKPKKEQIPPLLKRPIFEFQNQDSRTKTHLISSLMEDRNMPI